MQRSLATFACLVTVVPWCNGCSQSISNRTPITQDQVAEIKPGMTLVEIEAKLGPSYAATREQTGRLNQLTERMPPRVRESAMDGSGKDVAWGNDQGWLAGRMNEEQTVWMLSSQFGNSPPPHQSSRPKGMQGVPATPAFRDPGSGEE